ncbi:MAG: GAF domain-containing protein [Chloroflexi bacterium]|nr:GAF domain-containing protein [Chloroflexota bacterium]
MSPSVGVQPPEACFVIDGEQRVVQWSHTAAATLGIAAEAALGRRCFEVVDGRKLFRRTECQLGCGALAGLRSGRVSGIHRLTVQAGGTRRRFLCKPVTLPDPPGGAIVTLVPQSPPPGRSNALDTLHDLAALGALVASLRPDALARSIERILDWLREATGAEVAELFTVEPRGRDMLLTSFRGPLRSTFFQICRFQPGQGFPGLVEVSGEPIATRNLAADPRYLRSRVKDRGFQSYLCVPVRNSAGVIGALNVAARHTGLDLDRGLRLLNWASAPLGTLIQASSLERQLLETIPAPCPQAGAAASPNGAFLDIHCLGSFQLFRQGVLMTPDMVPRRGALAVLKILLMHRGRRVPRERLAELLWPEATPRAGANRLYLLIHTLRKLVEPAPRTQRWAFICNDGDRYYFSGGAPYRLDIEDFQSFCDLGRQRERGGDAAGAIAAYEAAAAVYRGDLLEDEPYAEWAWEERERLRETYLALLARLASLYAQRGNLEQSVDWYRQSLRVDPLREENHRALMSVLWQAGRRDEALRQYESCRTVLRQELDVAPLPETEQLYSCLKTSPGGPARSLSTLPP